MGYDRVVRRRSRSRDRDKRALEAALAEEAKDHFYYSSNRWGKGVNMPKLGSIYDQARIHFTDMVMARNNQDEDSKPIMMDAVALGKEWKWQNREIMDLRRKRKKDLEKAEKAAQGGRGGQSSYRNDSGRPPNRDGGYQSRSSRPSYGGNNSMLGKRNSTRR